MDAKQTASTSFMEVQDPSQDLVVPESRKTPYYPALDGMRTIAVAMVLSFHYASELLPWGWLGVQVFFVLSGFLITGILFDTAGDPFRFKNFYVRRALRIFPLYYAVLACLACISLLTHGPLSRSFLLWPFYLQNFWWLLTRGTVNDVLFTGHGGPFAAIGHLWSLAVEEQFYFLWPLIVFFVRDRRRLMQICIALILFRLGLAAFWQIHLTRATLYLGITYRMLPTQCDGLLMGGFLALWLRGKPSPRLQLRSGSLALCATLAYGALLTLLHLKPALIRGGDVFDNRGGFQATIGLPLCNLASTFVVLAVLQQGTWIYRLCQPSIMRSLGRVSYGIYVFHLPMRVLCASFIAILYRHFHIGLPQRATALLVALAATVALSYASYHFFEKRFLLLKNQFTSIRDPEARKVSAHPI